MKNRVRSKKRGVKEDPSNPPLSQRSTVENGQRPPKESIPPAPMPFLSTFPIIDQNGDDHNEFQWQPISPKLSLYRKDGLELWQEEPQPKIRVDSDQENEEISPEERKFLLELKQKKPVYFSLRNYANFWLHKKEKRFKNVEMSMSFNEFQIKSMMCILRKSPRVSTLGASFLFSEFNLTEIEKFYEQLLEGKSLRRKFFRRFKKLETEKNVESELNDFRHFKNEVLPLKRIVSEKIKKFLLNFFKNDPKGIELSSFYEKKMENVAISNWFINAKHFPLKEMLNYFLEKRELPSEELGLMSFADSELDLSDVCQIFRCWCFMMNFFAKKT